MVHGITGLSEEAVLDILALRLGAEDSTSSFVESILEVDEAADLLERCDIEALKADKTQAKTLLEQQEAFSKGYKGTDAKMTKHVRKGTQASAAPRALPFSITHSEARQFIPPKSPIWRGLTKNSWHGHRQNRKRVSAMQATMFEGLVDRTFEAVARVREAFDHQGDKILEGV